MRHVLRSGRSVLELTSGEVAGSGRRITFRDPEAATAYLRPFLQGGARMYGLRSMLYELAPAGTVHRLTDGEVVARIALALAAGHLRATRRIAARVEVGGVGGGGAEVAAFDAATGDAVPTRGGSKAPASTTWVTLELVDEAGDPVAGEAYQIRTPTNKTITGRLGEDGRARVEGVEPGTCSVTFPNLDGADWARAAS